MTTITAADTPLVQYALRLADNALVLGHRLSEWCGHAPMLEEDIALANIALDLLGQARSLYAHAGGGRGQGARRGRARLSARRRRVPQRAARRAAERRLRRHHRAAVPLRGLHGAALARARLVARRRRSRPSPRRPRRRPSTTCATQPNGSSASATARPRAIARAQAALDELWMYTGELFEVDAIERGARRARHRRRSAGPALPSGTRPSTGCSPRRRLRARPTQWMQTGGRPGATPSILATSSPRCSSCSAPIRERSGERCAGPAPARLRRAASPRAGRGASRARLGRRRFGRRSRGAGASPSKIWACCATSRSPMTARSRCRSRRLIRAARR